MLSGKTFGQGHTSMREFNWQDDVLLVVRDMTVLPASAMTRPDVWAREGTLVYRCQAC